ncbi:hypothetical protein J2J97_32265 (plasmid) [Rhizobium bangladeshense]|uniref:hypothetical protein n=1 Tax=Rhizobium bangladeshense TaxID=1138189 RepID=UPI001A9A13B9|nr:hypothetical protein [Rhizobium bangladeshense]QSY98580.1 hypothetical protein J2J97_32265 [Rhizobium bangladeshense]
MSRALELEELKRVAPELPDEPVPDFTRMMHDHVSLCRNGHHYSGFTYVRRVAVWQENQLNGDRRLTLDWVINGPGCPHCNRTKWSEENKDAIAARDKYEAEEGAIAQAKVGAWTPHRPRGVDL